MPHILLIEDNPGDAQLIREMYADSDTLDEEYEITHVTRVRDATTLLSSKHCIDLIISDMSLPDSQGLQTLESLTSIASNLPIIFMTGTNNITFVNAALKAGAQDYLVKGHIDAQVLQRTTAYSIERKKAQIQFARAVKKANDLEQSTELLQNEKDQLVQLNAVKDEFISLASHQLRTPATGVKQYLGMVLSGYAGAVSEDVEVFVKTAFDANERQLSIINELLKTAQLDSGRYKLEREETDLCALVQTVINDYKPITAMRRQTLRYVHADACTVHIDAAEIKIVMANLLENASKYSPKSSTITITIVNKQSTVEVQVSDQGVGIAKADADKVFEKFTRLNNALSDTISGTGLGLYFVKRIIKLHNGDIQVKSVLNKGSTFSFSLPL